jgi:hypothetical protein
LRTETNSSFHSGGSNGPPDLATTRQESYFSAAKLVTENKMEPSLFRGGGGGIAVRELVREDSETRSTSTIRLRGTEGGRGTKVLPVA